jgi:hypothetical protein
VNFFDMNTEGCDLRAEEKLIVASFTRRLIEIAAVSGARKSGSSPTAAFNAMRLPAIALDRKGIVVDVNAAAEVVFDNNIKIKDRRSRSGLAKPSQGSHRSIGQSVPP